MIFLIIGFDYKATPIKAREYIYSIRKELENFWRGLGVKVVTLTTCNRIELYLVFHDVSIYFDSIGLFYYRFGWILKTAYFRFGLHDMVRHVLRLSCGLESQLIGEGEILAQLYSWIKQESFPAMLREIFYEAIGSGESIRIRSGLNESREDISSFIFKDITEHLDISTKKDIVIVGTGKIAQLFSKSKPLWCDLCFVSRKKHKKARHLARISGGKAITLDDIENLLLKADILVSATASPHFVFKAERLAGISKKRDGPLYIYDMAMPRDVEPSSRDVERIFLKDISGLEPFFKKYREENICNINIAGSFIDEYVDRFRGESDGCLHKSWDSSELIGIKTG
ncbi:MAG: hypothetical protein ABIG92_06485 [Candidatus Omnitrophota bacterium]